MARQQGTGRRVTGGQVALVVVVVALVGVFLALLSGRMPDGADPSAGATATVPATGSPGEGTDEDDGDEPVTFTMPSGNIACQISAEAADCLIRDYSYDAVDAASCEGQAGAHVRVGEDGASMPCEPLVIAGDVPVLDYGESQSAHGFTCESSEEGVTCRHDASGQGFSLARAAYELF